MFRVATALLMTALMSLVAPDRASSQTSGTPDDRAKTSAKVVKQDDVPNDFLALADLRAVTNAEITNLEQRIKNLEENQIPTAENYERELSYTKDQITQLEKKEPMDPITKSQLDTLRSKLAFVCPLPPADVLRKQLTEAKQSLAEKRELAAVIQKKIGSLLNPAQTFKFWMTVIFSCLIGFVIVGFFYIARIDEKIRQEVFSSDAGMQLLTLFSLVIAIILFGITGILEGKELSALLGGLSGYILGRVTPKAKETAPTR